MGPLDSLRLSFLIYRTEVLGAQQAAVRVGDKRLLSA